MQMLTINKIIFYNRIFTYGDPRSGSLEYGECQIRIWRMSNFKEITYI